MSDAKSSTRVRQCATCPWRVACDPLTDIPNGYSVDLHARLSSTIAKPGVIELGKVHAMACHHSKVGAETPCAGWLANQIGSGNNIAVRVEVIRGRMPFPITSGEQHARFEDTLPEVTNV